LSENEEPPHSIRNSFSATSGNPAQACKQKMSAAQPEQTGKTGRQTSKQKQKK
jgi:hypothetical protein